MKRWGIRWTRDNSIKEKKRLATFSKNWLKRPAAESYYTLFKSKNMRWQS